MLLRPPTLTEEEGVEWALRSTEFAFDCGVSTVAVIPTRSGNGMMEQMQADGLFAPPVLASLEAVLETGLTLGRGRVFVDLWDTERFASGVAGSIDRIERLRKMNLTQRILPAVKVNQ